MNKDFIYIGIVSSYSPKKQFIVLKDIPPDIPDISGEIEIYFGFSTSFLQKQKVNTIENRKTNIHIFFSDDCNVRFEELLRMGVYLERSVIERYKSDYYGPEDLLDCLVYDKYGNYIGKVVDVHILPSQFVIYADSDTYIVPLPFMKELILEFNLKEKQIKLDLPENYMDIAELKE